MAVLLEPGKGQYREPPPVTEHAEYPKHMKHPGFQPGIPDREIKVIDPATGRPTGQLIYTGSQPIRYPDVLVHDAAQQEYHESVGYRSVGTSDPAAFAKAVATAAPPVLDYKPIEYPKWVFGVMVNSAEEEDARLIELNVNKDGSAREVVSSEMPSDQPAVATEVNSLEVWPREKPDMLPDEAHAHLPADVRHDMAVQAIAQQVAAEDDDDIEALEAKLAALREGKAARLARLKEELAAELAENEADDVISLVPPAEPAVMKEPSIEVHAPSDVAQDLAAERAAAVKQAKSDKMKAWHAERKAKKAAEDAA